MKNKQKILFKKEQTDVKMLRNLTVQHNFISTF